MRMLNMSLEERAQLLDNLEWAIQLSESELAKLSEFILVYEVTKDEQIFREGEDACFLALISSGDVRIVKENAKGQPKKIALLNQGEIFGEMALIDGHPRSASAYANSDALLLFLTEDNFDSLRFEFSVLGMKVLTSIAKAMSMRLRLTNDWLIDALNHSHTGILEIEQPPDEETEVVATVTETLKEENKIDLFAPPSEASSTAFAAPPPPRPVSDPPPPAMGGNLFAPPTGTLLIKSSVEETGDAHHVQARLDALGREVAELRERIEALEAGE